MTWIDKSIEIVRVLINDTDPEDMEFDEGRLEQLLSVAAHLVVQEIEFVTTYTVNIFNCTVSPEPVDQTDGVEFVNFVSLKAACLADLSTFRAKAAMAGLKAKLGPTQLETVQHLPGFKELLEVGPCASYKELRKHYMFGNLNIAKAVMTPFIGNDWQPPTHNDSIFFRQ